MSLSRCVIWNEGRAQCSPCIYHAALATIINLTRHLPSLHNHLHLQSLPAMLVFVLSFFLHLSLSLSPCHLRLLPRLHLLQFLNIVFLISTVAVINGIVQREWKADGFITQTNIITSKTSGTFCNDPCIIMQSAKHSISLQILLKREKDTTYLSAWKPTSGNVISVYQFDRKLLPAKLTEGVFRLKKGGQMFFNIWRPITVLLSPFFV